jgi:hypothetical protein
MRKLLIPVFKMDDYKRLFLQPKLNNAKVAHIK